MSIVFDRIVVAVPDLPAASAQYQRLFGLPPVSNHTLQGEPAAWWGLSNTVIELVQSAVNQAQLRGIVFSAPDATQGEIPIENCLGIDLRLDDGRRTADFRLQYPAAQLPGMAVDHVVLRTVDAQSCIDLFRDELGIRLALDRTAPAWGGRMLFFRAGKLTLEVIASDSDSATGNAFWGLAYQCPDLAGLSRTLAGRGVAVSSLREGRKPGTQVATLHSHCLDIPTLLLQPAT
jgi:catechol 2,3-dioxygenase-like lactoylglutathione lyase family enzyme